MARVGRLAGAILAETEGRYFVIGNPKGPCAWEAAGFVAPGVIDAIKTPFVELTRLASIASSSPALGSHVLEVAVEGEELARRLASRLLIERNGSVSERLWHVVIGGDEAPPRTDARWLGEIPDDVWQIVRDTVLKCS